MIQLQNLRYSIGQRVLFDHLDWVISPGDRCALVGPNGAGKTTLLRLLTAMARPTTGTARVAGTTPADDAAFLGRIGYLAQEVPLYRRWTADDHLAFGAHLNRRWDDGPARDRLTDLGIPLDRPVDALSGGMRAQVGLALTLAKRPEVLLLDEPLAALDPLARHEFLSSLAAAVAEHETTVLLSSHLLPDLERVCDHLVLLDSGTAVLDASIEDVLTEHRRVVAPAEASGALGRVGSVVRAVRSERRVDAVCRLTTPVLDPAWQVEDLALEEIVLAYLARAHRPGPALAVAR